MSTLMIEDLSLADEMDRTATTQVNGGRLPQVMVDYIQYVHDQTHPSRPVYTQPGDLPVPVGGL
jgi:hypothetical protein